MTGQTPFLWDDVSGIVYRWCARQVTFFAGEHMFKPLFDRATSPIAAESSFLFESMVNLP